MLFVVWEVGEWSVSNYMKAPLITREPIPWESLHIHISRGPKEHYKKKRSLATAYINDLTQCWPHRLISLVKPTASSATFVTPANPPPNPIISFMVGSKCTKYAIYPTNFHPTQKLPREFNWESVNSCEFCTTFTMNIRVEFFQLRVPSRLFFFLERKVHIYKDVRKTCGWRWKMPTQMEKEILYLSAFMSLCNAFHHVNSMWPTFHAKVTISHTTHWLQPLLPFQIYRWWKLWSFY